MRHTAHGVLDHGLHRDHAERDEKIMRGGEFGGAHGVPRDQARFTATTALWPPKAKEFEIATLTFALRASFGT